MEKRKTKNKERLLIGRAQPRKGVLQTVLLLGSDTVLDSIFLMTM